MSKRRWLILVVAAVVGLCWMAEAVAQPAGGGGDRRGGDARRGGDRRGGDRRGGDRGDWQARMEEFRKRMQDRMREQFGATEDEWKVLYPRIEKVQQLMRQSRGGFGGRGGRGGRGDRRPGGDRRPEGAPERQQSEVEKKTEALRNLLDDKASGAQAIKAALDALRAARQKTAQELAVARKELRQVVTMRQEARLVLTGVLD